MEVSPAIFRAYDIRGVVDEVLTPDVVREVGKAFGSECEARGKSGLLSPEMAACRALHYLRL